MTPDGRQCAWCARAWTLLAGAFGLLAGIGLALIGADLLRSSFRPAVLAAAAPVPS